MPTAWLLLDVKTRRLIRAILVLITLAMMGPALAQVAPAIPAATQPSTRPPAEPNRDDRRKLRQLSRKALEAAKAGKLDEAEGALAASLLIDPSNSTNLYNMA